MNTNQALQLLEQFRQTAVIPNGCGRDHDMIREALNVIALALKQGELKNDSDAK